MKNERQKLYNYIPLIINVGGRGGGSVMCGMCMTLR